MPRTSAHASSPKEALDALKQAFGGPEAFDEPHLLDQLILLVLAPQCDPRKVRAAMKRLQNDYVDWNEVRVSGTYEIRRSLAPLGQRRIGGRAEAIRGLLTTAYERFNKLDLDDLRAPSQETPRNRQRERFEAWLADRSPALGMAFSAQLEGREPSVDPGVARALQRLGFVRGPAIGGVRKWLAEAAPEGERALLLWRLHLLVETWCEPKEPRCSECALLDHCSTGAQRTASSGPSRRKAGRKITRKVAKKKAAKEVSSAGETPPRKAAKKAARRAAKKAAKKASATRKKASTSRKGKTPPASS